MRDIRIGCIPYKYIRASEEDMLDNRIIYGDDDVREILLEGEADYAKRTSGEGVVPLYDDKERGYDDHMISSITIGYEQVEVAMYSISFRDFLVTFYESVKADYEKNRTEDQPKDFLIAQQDLGKFLQMEFVQQVVLKCPAVVDHHDRTHSLDSDLSRITAEIIALGAGYKKSLLEPAKDKKEEQEKQVKTVLKANIDWGFAEPVEQAAAASAMPDNDSSLASIPSSKLTRSALKSETDPKPLLKKENKSHENIRQ